MPNKIVSKAQQGFLAIHKPGVLHELSGGHIPNAKSLPEHVRSGGIGMGRKSYHVGKDGKGPLAKMYAKGKDK